MVEGRGRQQHEASLSRLHGGAEGQLPRQQLPHPSAGIYIFFSLNPPPPLWGRLIWSREKRKWLMRGKTRKRSVKLGKEGKIGKIGGKMGKGGEEKSG